MRVLSVGVLSMLALTGCGATGTSEPKDAAGASSATESSSSAASVSPSGSGSSSADGASSLPGGVVDEVLKQGTWFDSEGRLYNPESAPDDATQAALCTFLFGGPQQVASTAKLAGKVTLNGDSGFATLGGGGSGVRCGYDVNGKTVYQLRIWSQASEGSSGTHIVTVQGSPRIATSAYAPGYSGPAIDNNTAKEWLTAALNRTAP